MTLKQMLDDKDKKINDLRIEMNEKIEGIKLELKNEIKDLNEIKEFVLTGQQFIDNYDWLKGRVAFNKRSQLILGFGLNSNSFDFYYISNAGTVSQTEISFGLRTSFWMPASLGKYLGLKPA